MSDFVSGFWNVYVMGIVLLSVVGCGVFLWMQSSATHVAGQTTGHVWDEDLQEFSNPNGSFMQGDLYIYAYGYNGTTLAHPVNPETIGKIREGRIGEFVRDMGAVVKNGSGFYRFTYINPAHNNTLEAKLGYGVQVEEDWWIGSGIYLGPVESPAPQGTGNIRGNTGR